jgi:hypothetical protein
MHFIEHILGVCADSKTHINLVGVLLEPQFIQTIFNYLKTTFKL